MKKPLISVTRNVLDEATSKKVGKKVFWTTVISDGIIVGSYLAYLRWAKKKEEKEEAMSKTVE